MAEISFLSSPIYQEALGEVKLIMDGAAQRHIDLFGQPWYVITLSFTRIRL